MLPAEEMMNDDLDLPVRTLTSSSTHLQFFAEIELSLTSKKISRAQGVKLETSWSLNRPSLARLNYTPK
jgi:hypothetical protein